MYVMGEGSPEGLLRFKYDIVHQTRGVGIELGRGSFKAFPHFLGVREREDKTVLPTVPADYWVDSFEDLKDMRDDVLDFVFVWGEVDLTDKTLSEIKRVLKPGGKKVHAPSWGGLDITEFSEDESAGYFREVDVWLPPWDKKTVCIVRHGAIGDTMQATSILPELKRQGYHVTWMGEPQAEELLRHDPHIDAFLVQDRDQVPNQELTPYWKHWEKKFDRWINLCESVEGALIKLPGRSDYLWPDALRREMCGQNYLEFIAKMAELPFHPEHKFYASDDETTAAKAYVAKLDPMAAKAPYVIMWALAGSAVHKFYPHQDAVIARILVEIPEAHVILTGDPLGMILEAGWENEPRLHCESGKMALRETLALAQQCDLIIGPETGVLNAMAFESSAKICLLSHSSTENLVKHWVNGVGLHSAITPCYPCHRLHYTRDYCPEHKESGASMCQADLNPSDVWTSVAAAYKARQMVKDILRNAA